MFKNNLSKFIKLSKYDSSLVSNCRNEMSLFVMGVFDVLVEECRDAILYDNMKISHLMVHSQQVEESRLKNNNRDA